MRVLEIIKQSWTRPVLSPNCHPGRGYVLRTFRVCVSRVVKSLLYDEWLSVIIVDSNCWMASNNFNFHVCFRWFCHFDDDNYVNIPRLLEILSNYNPQKDWYLGKPSIRTPLEIQNKEHPHLNENTVSVQSVYIFRGHRAFTVSPVWISGLGQTELNVS